MLCTGPVEASPLWPDSRLFVGARPAAVSSAACAGSSCQSLFDDEERSITVAQLQRWIGQRIRHSRRREARTDATHHDPVITALPPRMKPAITMLSPVPTKARVLILASFEELPD